MGEQEAWLVAFELLIGTGLGLPSRMQALTWCTCYAEQELDFVLANVLMALVADFMLVWLPAPTLSYRRAHAPHLSRR